jgi:hypothetical protein
MTEPWNLTETQRRQIREAHASAKERRAAMADRPLADCIMSCPCGRGDYHLCRNCPYDFCSVHGTPEPDDITCGETDEEASRP